jgi:hypothetical protein
MKKRLQGYTNRFISNQSASFRKVSTQSTLSPAVDFFTASLLYYPAFFHAVKSRYPKNQNHHFQIKKIAV